MFRPNCSPAHIAYARVAIGAGPTDRLILVDCSHDNSGKDHLKQPGVFRDVLSQYVAGERAILGMMLESNLQAGKQAPGPKAIPGKSITDACIDWATTESLLREAHARMTKVMRSFSFVLP